MDSAHEVNPVTSVERNAEEPCKVQLKRTPLPKVQLFVALLIQFAEPITGTVIYPFINQFVEETGITGGDERKTGYYAGFIESVFFMGEATSVLYWGRASDYLGRKPILLLGPLGLTLTTLFFGLSKTFWFLVVWRCLQGVFNGNIGVSKTVMAEITDATNMADAYALIAVMWGVGATLGPTMGGLLANPADRWPALFGNPFFRYYPYFLPCAVAAAIAFMSFLIAGVALRETLPSAIRRKQRKLGSHSDGSKQRLITNADEPNYGSTNSNDLETNHEISSKPEDSQGPPSIREILNPKMTIAMTVYAFASFVDMCAQALQPLVYFTSPANGGLGFDPYTIGVIMGVWGLTNGIAQTLFAGPIIRRIGPKNTVIWSLVTYLLGFVTFPMLRFYAHSAGYADFMTWVVLIAQLVLAFGRYITYTAIQIIIIESAPSKSSLGTTNGLAQAVGSIMRAIAPSVASSLFSLSLEKQLMGGNMVFMVLILLNGFAIRLATKL